MSDYAVLVMAKAPHPGTVKTRLAATVGDQSAAEVAAAALLDTLEVATSAVGAGACHLALSGDLTGASGEARLRSALAGWHVFGQRGHDFATRLAAAHADAGPGHVVQIGMDTPQVTVADLASVAAGLHDHAAVLGPATDGGWWVLGRDRPRVAEPLAGVEMSTPRTYDDTRAAVLGSGWSVGRAATMRDVDTLDDAEAVAALAPGTRFARVWRGAREREAPVERSIAKEARP